MGQPNAPFLSGVIEGFYGPIWTRAERLQLFRWMSDWGLDTYQYGPKDDIHHRAAWRVVYDPDAAAELKSTIDACTGNGIRFAYAIGPGLDVRYSNPGDLEAAVARFRQVRALGATVFCLLFDDIPDRMDPADSARWGSLAAAQAAFANSVRAALESERPGGRHLFCPTPYCGRMALRGHGGPDYLPELGRLLDPAIDIFWTGPEIVSETITLEHVEHVTAQLRRPPVIWDNLHANDYDGRRFYVGPYQGRPLELRNRVRGILSNPNTEFALNRPGLQTLGGYLAAGDSWDARAAYVEAMRDWLPDLDGWKTPMTLEELVLLGDCYYLPYEEGPGAQALRADIAALLAREPDQWGPDAILLRDRIVRLREVCGRIADLRNRDLFRALSRRVWELREELDLLERYLNWRMNPATRQEPFHSDFHQPLTYRGGLVPSLQRLLKMDGDGAFAAVKGVVPCQG